MKKIKFLLGMFVIAASTSLLSSCFTDPTFGEAPNVPNPSVEAEYTINLTTNVPATVEYDGTTYPANTNFVITTTKLEGGELTVSATGYVDQKIKVVLGDNKNIALDVKLIKILPTGVTVGDADEKAGETVVNGTGATITIPGGEKTKDVDPDEEYGIGVYSSVGVAEVPTTTTSTEVAHDVLVAVCQPDGAEFDTAVKITVDAPNAGGLKFNCTSSNPKENEQPIDIIAPDNANTISAEVYHFSNWTFSLMAKVVSIEESEITLFDGNILVGAGSDNKLNYTSKVGFESSRTGIAETFLAGLFGSKVKSVAKTSFLTSSGTGSAHVRVTQALKKITYESNGNRFTATVYGAVRINVMSTTFDTTEHSGGNGGN